MLSLACCEFPNATEVLQDWVQGALMKLIGKCFALASNMCLHVVEQSCDCMFIDCLALMHHVMCLTGLSLTKGWVLQKQVISENEETAPCL